LVALAALIRELSIRRNTAAMTDWPRLTDAPTDTEN